MTRTVLIRVINVVIMCAILAISALAFVGVAHLFFNSYLGTNPFQ